jgi:CelD/BcsL family acetyltransferase involved in cellulose biosynthesis
VGHDPRTILPPRRRVAAEYAVETATTAAEVEALRPAWLGFDWPDVEAQLDFYLATLATRDGLLRPHAVAVMRDGVPQAMLLARIEPVRALPADPPLHLLARPMTAAVVPGGLQGTPEARVIATRALFSLTRRGRVRAINFRDCAPDGPQRDLLRRTVPRPLRAPVVGSAQRWFIDLPESYEAYFASLSRNLRRARRREAAALESSLGPRLSIDRHTTEERADALLADLEHVAVRSYQRTRGVGFERRRHEPLVRAALARRLARAWILRIDDRPVAYELGWVHGGTYRGAFIGYIDSFGPHAVGGYVEQTVLRELCADPDVRVYDQGVGDFTYKRRLSNRVEPRTDLWAFQASPAGLTLKLLRTGYEAARWARRRSTQV